MREWTKKIIEEDRAMLWWGKPSKMSPEVKAEFIKHCDAVDRDREKDREESFAKRWGGLTVEEVLKLNEAARRTCEEDS